MKSLTLLKAETLDILANLLTYPAEATSNQRAVIQTLKGALDETCHPSLEAFETALKTSELWQLEEWYTQTFDFNPDTTLEVGWHLYGEDYARGEFLVAMRQKMRAVDLPETTELPDHLQNVLGVLARLPEEETQKLISTVIPALEKLQQNLEGKETPYIHVVTLIATVLQSISQEGTAYA